MNTEILFGASNQISNAPKTNRKMPNAVDYIASYDGERSMSLAERDLNRSGELPRICKS